MKVCFFSCFDYEAPIIKRWNIDNYDLVILEEQLSIDTVNLAEGSDVVSIFSRDHANAKVLKKISEMGIKCICLRSTGFNNIDLAAATKLNLQVTRVPAYSPEAIAEHAIAMILAISRKLVQANRRVKLKNFSLVGLLGFNLGEKTVGVIGTGKIGSAFIKMLHGFGCKILAYDFEPDLDLATMFDIEYVSLKNIFERADIISLHLPLNDDTYQIINEDGLAIMKNGAIIINTSRGDHIDTKALIKYLANGKISAVGLDVYANEKKYFFKDRSDEAISDLDLVTLLGMDNVLMTAHQAFLTSTALSNIAETTFDNIKNFSEGKANINFLLR